MKITVSPLMRGIASMSSAMCYLKMGVALGGCNNHKLR